MIENLEISGSIAKEIDVLALMSKIFSEEKNDLVVSATPANFDEDVVSVIDRLKEKIEFSQSNRKVFIDDLADLLSVAFTQQQGDFKFCGNWRRDSKYKQNNIVFYDGSSYIALDGSINVEPTKSLFYWAPLAIGSKSNALNYSISAIPGPKGDKGDPGPQGPPGSTGGYYGGGGENNQNAFSFIGDATGDLPSSKQTDNFKLISSDPSVLSIEVKENLIYGKHAVFTLQTSAISGSSSSSPSPSAAIAFSWNEDISSSINGINSIFVLGSPPFPVSSLMLFKNGLLQREGSGNDFVFSGTNFVIFDPANIPVTGDVLVCNYQYVVSSSSQLNFSWNEIPTGSINDVNDTFFISNSPATGSIMLFKNGLRQNEGISNDFVISGQTITFNSSNIPKTDDIIICSYQY